MKRLIFNVFATEENYYTSSQIGGKAGEKVTDIYMKNAYVSLVSAKQNSNDLNTDYALIVNKDISADWVKRYSKAGIIVKKVSFDTFLFPEGFSWALAFYKLNAMKYVATHMCEYGECLYLDCDTVIRENLDAIWAELEGNPDGVMMYSVDHSILNADRKVIIQTNEIINGKWQAVTHFGGEFVCAKRVILKEFMETVESVYHKIKEIQFEVPTDIGDEALLSIAAREWKIIYANPYIYRFWTDRNFYLVSNNTVYNPVLIWHLPQEKRKGILRVYNYMIKNDNQLPNDKNLLNYLSLPNGRKPFKIYDYWWRILCKLGKC